MAETYFAHRAQISMAEETTPGTTVSAPAHYPFHCTSFDLPEETIDWKTIKAIGAGRDFNSIAEGAHSFEGSVDATLIKGDILYYAFGMAQDTGTRSATGDVTLSTAFTVGSTTATLSATTGQITAGVKVLFGATGYHEIRTISDVSGKVVILSKPLRFTAAKDSTARLMTGSTYVHTLTVGNTLKSFTLEAGYDGTTDIRKKWNGCYINTCEIGCEEEGMLNANLGIMGMNTSTADTSITTVTVPTTVPYMFDEGVITCFGGTLAQVKSFKVNINNNLKALKYIQATTGRNPYEIVPGNRTIEITMTAVPQDNTWREKMRPGSQSTGTTFTAKFSRSASDYLQISCTSAMIKDYKSPIPEEGEINAELTLVARTCTVTTSDTTPYYWMV